MFCTNTLSLTMKQEDFTTNVVESILKKNFDDNKTTHFSFEGTRLNLKSHNFQSVFEFWNNEVGFWVTVDHGNKKQVLKKTFNLEKQ